MSERLARVKAVFVAPAGPMAAPVAVRATAAPTRLARAVLLCPARDAWPLAGALALALGRASGARSALVCRWEGETDAVPVRAAARAPALPAARKLAARLVARDLPDVAPSGRLARLDLSPEPAVAVAEATRAAGAAESAGAPAVIALAGPRVRVLDAVLGQADVVVVASADCALARLALADLAGLRVPAVAIEPALGGLARILAAAGIVGAARVGEGFAPALEALA